MEITGLVLSGGESKRMGSDKGLLLKNGKPWVSLMGEQFSAVGLAYKVSINAHQRNSYQFFFDAEDLMVDALDIPGPLRGILTAHLSDPLRNWLVLACDMIDMDTSTVERVLEKAEKTHGFDFYIYKNASFYEPFCGIYTASGLKKWYDLYQSGQLNRYGLQHLFDGSSTCSLPVGTHGDAFKNYNQL